MSENVRSIGLKTELKTDIRDISLNFVKNFLRVDYDDDDELILMMMTSCRSFIQTHVNLTFDEMENELGQVPNELNMAFLSMIKHWYDRRELQSDKGTDEELRYVFTDILNEHRDFLSIKGVGL